MKNLKMDNFVKKHKMLFIWIAIILFYAVSTVIAFRAVE